MQVNNEMLKNEDASKTVTQRNGTLIHDILIDLLLLFVQQQQQLLDPPRQLLNSEEPMEADEEQQPTAAEEEEGKNDEEEQDHTKMPEHPGRDSDSDEDGEA